MTPMTEERTLTGTWNADTVHSHVAFEVPYAAGTFRGEVPEFQATLRDGLLEGAARISSLEVKDENLLAHLLSPEFFDAATYPTVSFRSYGPISLEQGDAVEIDGELTIKGITRPVTLQGELGRQITDAFGNERIGLRLSTTIDRTEFGMNWNMELPAGGQALADEVTLRAELQFVQEDAQQ